MFQAATFCEGGELLERQWGKAVCSGRGNGGPFLPLSHFGTLRKSLNLSLNFII